MNLNEHPQQIHVYVSVNLFQDRGIFILARGLCRCILLRIHIYPVLLCSTEEQLKGLYVHSASSHLSL